MDTFKQYFLKNINEMGETRVPIQMKKQAQQVLQTAHTAARGRGTPEEMSQRMSELAQLHKTLDAYSSEDIKSKIVQKYNQIKHFLEQPQEEVDITTQNLMDCVEYITELYEFIIND